MKRRYRKASKSAAKSNNTSAFQPGAATGVLSGKHPNGFGQPSTASHTLPHQSHLRDVSIGVALILALVLAKVSIEHVRPIEHLSLATYDAIQGMLQSDEVPVVVVDISNLNSVSWTEGRSLTDRKTLGEVVALIAQQRPVAIGIDVDFSPNYDPLAAPGTGPNYHAPEQQDPDFFNLCLRSRQNGVPVYLGVYRSSNRPRSERLVRPEYAQLAADIRVDVADNRLIPESFDWQANGDELPSLSAASAQAFRSRRTQVPSWLRWALHGEVLSRAGKNGWIREFYVDFSPVEQFMQSRVNFIDMTGAIDRAAFENIRHNLAGKIVLLGAADPANPKEGCFTIPGQRQAFPGIYLHAAAAYSQVHCPLLVLTPAGRIVVDVLLASIVLAAIYLLRWRLGRTRWFSLNQDWQRRLPWLITLTAMGLAFVLGVLFVNITHVIWDDFVIVFVALGLHVPIERQVEKWAHARQERFVE